MGVSPCHISALYPKRLRSNREKTVWGATNLPRPARVRSLTLHFANRAALPVNWHLWAPIDRAGRVATGGIFIVCRYRPVARCGGAVPTDSIGVSRRQIACGRHPVTAPGVTGVSPTDSSRTDSQTGRIWRADVVGLLWMTNVQTLR